MIHYQLRCADAHEFDGWFRNSAAFEAQVQAGLLDCPACGSREVTRALMAPAVPRKENARRVAVPTAADPSSGPPANGAVPNSAAPAGPPPHVAAAGGLPAHLLAMLQKMRSEVEKNCDYVGPEFAEEARKIHRGESEQRSIYGESTPDEAQALADEGIEISQIPWVPRADG